MMSEKDLRKEVKEFFNNTGLKMNDKNIEEFEKVFEYVKNGIIRTIIEDLKDGWSYEED